MADFPQARTIDDSVALLADGYTYVGKRCAEHNSDVFETRLMLQNVTCVQGEDAARMFYTPGRFTRKGAMPPTALLLLQDIGSVQMLDGAAHHQRKAMFLSVLDEDGVARLANTVAEEWRAALPRWAQMDKVVLHPQVRAILTRAVCRWAGVPLHEEEVKPRANEFGEMIDGAAAVGPRNWRAQWLRMGTERWAKAWIDDIRSRKRDAPVGSAAYVIALHRDPEGELLSRGTAAVELINVLRPTVAVARFITFAALALHEHPHLRARVAAADDQYLEWFAQEVRRFYPFFPVVGGKACVAFEWRGHAFKPGDWVLLDMYGTNHDPRIWAQPEVFDPERFRHWDGNPYTLVAQGGGDYAAGHRCPGEPATVEIVKTALRLLTQEMDYEVPKQALRLDLHKMPALPPSKFILRHVQATPPQFATAPPPA
jgi:fatty-acid peroxygenase